MARFPVHSFGADKVFGGMRRREEEQNQREQQVVTAYMTAARTGTLDKFPEQMKSMIQQNYPNQWQMGQALGMQFKKKEAQEQRGRENVELSHRLKVHEFLLKRPEANAAALDKSWKDISAKTIARGGPDLSDIKFTTRAELRAQADERWGAALTKIKEQANVNTLDADKIRAEEIEWELENLGKLKPNEIAGMMGGANEKLQQVTAERQTRKANEEWDKRQQTAQDVWQYRRDVAQADAEDAATGGTDFERAFQGRRNQALNRAEFKNQVWSGPGNKGEAARQALSMLSNAFEWNVNDTGKGEVMRQFAKNSLELGPIDAATQTIREMGGNAESGLTEKEIQYQMETFGKTRDEVIAAYQKKYGNRQ